MKAAFQMKGLAKIPSTVLIILIPITNLVSLGTQVSGSSEIAEAIDSSIS
jgi:hypothetical protein